MNLCSFRGIFIWGLLPVGNAYEMCIGLKDFKKLKPLLRKTQTRISIMEKKGLPFFFFRNRKRKVYFAGAVLCIMLLYLYSGFIWDIHFEGNQARTSETLLVFLESKKVEPGMKKRDVDCEQIVKDLRSAYDDIVWVSASIDGSRLTIQVKENDDIIQSKPAEEVQETPKDLVAEKDATIVEIVTRQGVPLVHAGDAVKAGDILVTGRVEVQNDADEVIAYQYHTADADIYGATIQEYQDTMDMVYDKKRYYIQKNQKVYYLQIGNLRIATGKLEHSDTGYEVCGWEKQVKFGESMYLPVYFGQIKQKEYKWIQGKYKKEEVQKQMSDRFHSFCEELEKKGVQITENNVKILIDKKQARAAGNLSLVEPLGKPADTEILTIERKETDESIGNDN